ncbi:MAG: type II toxin-antitoxin system VapC family toxin [Chloroflexi bacterium]|nr:type II toxin-antitoxin system VapC family toxin [Chloroflexota bacterium]
MAGKYLLDTSIIIALFANDGMVKENLAQATEVFVPSIVLGELYYGVWKSAQVEENLKRVDEFAASNVVLACDSGTARQYGAIKNALRTKGRPIPENDIWIAAISLQRDLTLVTRDTHFAEIENLRTVTW